MEEGKGADRDEVGVARKDDGGGGGQRGKGDKGAIGGSTGEDLIAASGGEGLEGGGKAQFL